jgi:hypothetical protein
MKYIVFVLHSIITGLQVFYFQINRLFCWILKFGSQ